MCEEVYHIVYVYLACYYVCRIFISFQNLHINLLILDFAYEDLV